MIASGRTVFDGTALRSRSRPASSGCSRTSSRTRRDLIVARLEGGPLAKPGVIAGMSGSPVYIDGRLVGAVSYALGTFAKEPIAGITPIADMTDSIPPGADARTGARWHRLAQVTGRHRSGTS